VCVYADLEEALEKESLLVGIACFQNDKNPDLCCRLAEGGVHILSEKPIGISSTEVTRVLEACQQAEVRLGVMYQNRYHPITQDARNLVQKGVIGKITACEARMVTSQVKFRNPEHWLFDKEKSGGGILSWLGCHYIDLLCYVTGDDIVAVSALVDTLSGESIDVEDVASVSFRFQSGALGSLQAGYQLAMSKSGYIGPNYDSYIAFRGTAGRIFWNPSGKEHLLYVESAHPDWAGAPQRTQTYNLPEIDAYGGAYGVAFLEDFLDAALGNGTAPATGEDALKVAHIVEAAYASSQSGTRVNLR
ncbi:MAG: Gfo/Idh/MocA family oxidoreductase, partial [bacterium]|nr:Gfo/Idh/MocA family oxidoreductase [bacterium]